MTTRNDLAERATKLAAHRSEEASQSEPTPDTTPRPSTAPHVAPRSKPVRVTVDLAPQSYRSLIAYASKLAVSFGSAKVSNVAVVRALLAELEHDPELENRVAQRVATELSK